MARGVPLLLLVLAPACGGKAVIDGEPDDTSSSSTGMGGQSSSTGGHDFSSVEVVSALLDANCQPIPPPDPLDARIELRFVNDGGDTSVTVSGAEIRGTGVTKFTVMPETFTVPAGTSIIHLQKTPGSASGTAGCDWCSESAIDLFLTFTIAGEQSELGDTVDSLSCLR